jgi:hypothetical protein
LAADEYGCKRIGHGRAAGHATLSVMKSGLPT